MNAATPPYDLRAVAGGIARTWNTFFHTEVDARIFAWLRIGWALMVLIFGAWSRINAVCVLAWLISFQHRNPIICDSEDIVSRLIGWYVVLMPTNLAWSVDAWRRRPALATPVMAPAWGLRLLQLQMSAIFLGAAWQKLGGDPWRDGTAMFYVTQLDDYFGRTPLPEWFHETPWIMKGMTWSSIAIEIIVPIGVWFRQTRVPMLLLALAFHLSTDLMMHLFLFHWLMLVGWSAFVLPQDFAWLGRILRKFQAVGAQRPQSSPVETPEPQQAQTAT